MLHCFLLPVCLRLYPNNAHTIINSTPSFGAHYSKGNESCPQPQTAEHLAAIEIMKLKHIIILQNKIDLIKDAAANEQYQQILKFIKGLHRLFVDALTYYY